MIGAIGRVVTVLIFTGVNSENWLGAGLKYDYEKETTKKGKQPTRNNGRYHHCPLILSESQVTNGIFKLQIRV